MKEQVKGILFDLKDAGWTVQKVEKELKFSNGSLGKVVSGKTNLSEFRYAKLLFFHSNVVGKPPTVTEGLKEQIRGNNTHEKKAKIQESRNPPQGRTPYMSEAIKKKLGIN